MVLLDFSMFPLGKGESLSPYVARGLDIVGFWAGLPKNRSHAVVRRGRVGLFGGTARESQTEGRHQARQSNEAGHPATQSKAAAHTESETRSALHEVAQLGLLL